MAGSLPGMSEDVERDEASEAGEKKRRRLFWILVVAVFAAVIVAWLAFFGDTIFNINTTASSNLFNNLGNYWKGVKGSFSNAFEQITSTSSETSTDTTTENQATSTQ